MPARGIWRGRAGIFRISVTDTGGGISPEDYPRVSGASPGRTSPLVAHGRDGGRNGSGQGPGRGHNGGRTRVESTPGGVGSTFSFLLPVAVVVAAVEARADDSVPFRSWKVIGLGAFVLAAVVGSIWLSRTEAG